MQPQRRTQEQRSAATRDKLIGAARMLWAQRGFAAVGTPEIASAAGVTRGAMYHQFTDKTALFLAVVETVEAEVAERLAAMVAAAEPATPAAALGAAVDAWLEICVDPEIRQLTLLDAPSVLGWQTFRQVTQRYSVGMAEHMLVAAMDAGQLPRQPSRPLAHILVGALDEAAMVIATAEHPDQTRTDVRTVLHRLIDGILTVAD